MAFTRSLGSAPKSTSKEVVIDVIKLVPDATTPTVAGRNAASVARDGAGDYTITLNGVGSELIGVCTGAEDAEGVCVTWNSYSATNKQISVLVTDDAGSALETSDSITLLLLWNNSGVTENS